MRRHILVAVSIVAYVALYTAMHARWERGWGFFILIPLITGSLLYGKRFGLPAGLLSHPINLSLGFLLQGRLSEEAFHPNKALAWIGALAVGAVIGHLADLNLRLRAALDEVSDAAGDEQSAA